MKKLKLLTLSLLVAGGMLAQSNVSQPMDFVIRKKVIPPILSVVGTPQFVDEDNNGVIDAKENCKIVFDVVNTGQGEGLNCVARASIAGNSSGITISEVSLPTIPVGGKAHVEVPIKANENTVRGSVAIAVEVEEPHGFGTQKVNMKIGTHELKTPDVQVASYKAGSNSGVLKRRENFHLHVIVQNLDQGKAENVKVRLVLPPNLTRLDGEEFVTIPKLMANETKEFDYELIANNNAAENVEIGINLSEANGHARGTKIPLKFGQSVGGTITTTVARNDDDVDITKRNLTSDVDENIPVASQKNNNAFALIIANEKYDAVASVPYALSDGQIFYQYCEKTLGVPTKHIKFIQNATGNQIKSAISWIQNVSETFDDPQIIFYYAGHGIPDERNLTAYLLPTDGSGTDVTTGYKLDDLYATLGQTNAANVTVFLDACFSGSKREDGMIASARGVALKAKTGVPQGNMVVFSAATGSQTAYPYKEKQHGMFTYFLLKKLQDSKGDITLKELGEYIKTKVSQTSIIENTKQQTPCVIPSSSLGTTWQNWMLKKK